MQGRPTLNLGRLGLYAVCGLVFLFLVFPILIVVPMAFSSAQYLAFPPPGFSLQWWQEYFSRPDWTSATILSFQVAVVAMILATALGTAASFTLVRAKFRGKNLVYSIILSPIIIPPIIIAIAAYFFYAGLHLVGNWIPIALGHTILALPVVVVIVSATLKGFDETLEHAAMNLGANQLTTFRRVTFPLIRPGVVTAALFAFMISFDELLIALFLSGENAVTLPKRMWDGLRLEINPTIPVVSTLLIVISLGMLALVQVMRTRSEPASEPEVA
jgi:putative spermidine/putrescine transport system permease protein